MNIKETKKNLRTNLLKELSDTKKDYRLSADRKIFNNLLSSEEYKNSKIIFSYYGMNWEIKTSFFIEKALKKGKRICLPKCRKLGEMDAVEISNLEEDLHTGYCNLTEPISDSARINPDELDLIIIPCLACDIKGNRIGYGGGFYDRYLQKTGAIKIILCREKFILNTIPTETHDIPSDLIISESKIYYSNTSWK